MKVLSSLKSAKARHRDCKVVRRRGKVFVIAAPSGTGKTTICRRILELGPGIDQYG